MKKDFLEIADFSRSEIMDMLDLSVKLKAEYFKYGNPPILRGKVLAMVFNKPSLRTRISFDMAMRHLGGDALFISPTEIGLGKRESIADVARVLSGYVSAIMARVFDHSHVVELAEWASVPVINGLSDYNHPCQAIADVLTIYERFVNLEGLNVSYVGDGNNVALSLMYTCAKLGMNFNIATPEGFEIDDEQWSAAMKIAEESGSVLKNFRNPAEAVTECQVVYTDTWTSMGQEEEAEERMRIFPPYQVNKELLSHADKSAIVMHCLPAHRGFEITDEVADGSQSVIFEQAHNRLHAQKAILVQFLT